MINPLAIHDEAEEDAIRDIALALYLRDQDNAKSRGPAPRLFLVIGVALALVVFFNIVHFDIGPALAKGQPAANQPGPVYSGPATRPNLARSSVPLRSVPSVDAAFIDKVLTEWGSPLAGKGSVFMAAGKQFNINPAIALAFCIHESGCMTNPAWAGWIDRPGGLHTWDLGNIICAGSSPYWDGSCFGRFRQYHNADDGIYDWFYLIDTEYINGRGHEVVADVTPIYAPWLDNNNPTGYGNAVDEMIMGWANDQGL